MPFATSQPRAACARSPGPHPVMVNVDRFDERPVRPTLGHGGAPSRYRGAFPGSQVRAISTASSGTPIA